MVKKKLKKSQKGIKYRKFKANWNPKIYGDLKPKIVTMRFITEKNGFSKKDKIRIDKLKLYEKYREPTPYGTGLTLERIV
jgi:hypothetical protein